MTEDTLSRVFEPFFTTKPPGEGTGLGLSTVYGVVEQNSGSIKVDSKIGGGTRFTITFPSLEPEAGEDAGTRVESEVEPEVKKELIMLVEDEELVRNLTAKVLDRAGYEVVSFASPTEAIQKVIDEQPPVSLLITDVVMPEMNGRDLADRLTELKPDLKKLFMSGYTNEVISSRGIENGDVPFIQKPFTPAGLIGKIREML
jgi:CheY-like chemotaxis protein